MVEVKEKCKCIEKLMNLGKIQYYCPPYNTINYNYEEVDEGTLCLVNNQVYDNGKSINIVYLACKNEEQEE